MYDLPALGTTLRVQCCRSVPVPRGVQSSRADSREWIMWIKMFTTVGDQSSCSCGHIMATSSVAEVVVVAGAVTGVDAYVHAYVHALKLHSLLLYLY
jgi:hypothetical protein